MYTILQSSTSQLFFLLQIRSQVDESVPEQKVLLEIEKVFNEKKKRLTDWRFLEKLKKFAGPLLAGAGIVLTFAFAVMATSR